MDKFDKKERRGSRRETRDMTQKWRGAGLPRRKACSRGATAQGQVQNLIFTRRHWEKRFFPKNPWHRLVFTTHSDLSSSSTNPKRLERPEKKYHEGTIKESRENFRKLVPRSLDSVRKNRRPGYIHENLENFWNLDTCLVLWEDSRLG